MTTSLLAQEGQETPSVTYEVRKQCPNKGEHPKFCVTEFALA